MKMKVSSVAFAMLLAIFATSACAERLQIDIAALAASTNQYTSENKVATTNGWTLFAIDSYAGKPNIRLSEKGDYLFSPTFSQRVLSIELKVKSSSLSGRRLAFIPIYDGVPSEDATLCSLCNYAPNKDTYVAQTNCFPRAADVRSCKMSFDSGGGSTGWGVSEMTIVTDDTPVLTPPTNLSASYIKGTRFRLSWANPENAVSNKIEVSEIVETETSGGSILEYDFNDFTNNSGSATDITDDFTNAIPAFAGSSLIRLPANTNGIIQISKDTAKGYLVHSGFADYSSMSLAMSIRRPTSDHGKTFGIGYLSAEGTTNEFATFSLEVEFRTNTVSLASVPANASIILNTQGANSKRVVYIDYMAFIGDSLSTDLSTNLAKTAFVTDSTTYSVRGLCPRTEYVARITAFDADGNESSPSEPLAVTTNGEAIPFSIHIK